VETPPPVEPPGGTGDGSADGTVDETRCVVPKIDRGTKLGAVKRELAGAACSAGKVTRTHSKSVRRGKLIKVKPKPGTVLEAGAPVAIVLSSGPRPR
jgi:beta-lactam-binding protein with PASTA domain